MKTQIKSILKKIPGIKQLVNRFANIKRQLDQQKKQLNSLKAENEKLENKLKNLTDMSEKERQQSVLLQKSLNEMEKKYAELGQRLSEQEKQLADQNTNYEKNIKAVSDNYTKSAKVINDNAYQIRSLKKKTSELSGDIMYWFYRGLPKEKYKYELECWYLKRMGQRLDLDHPVTFSEKLNWLKIYDSTPLKSKLADKYEVREWITEKGYADILVPLLCVADQIPDIDFTALPNQYVIKANHGWNYNVIVTDSHNIDINELNKKFDRWLKINFAYAGLEMQYAAIRPRIVVEEYLGDASEIMEYKVMCFGGKPEFILLDHFTEEEKCRNLYDVNWVLLPVRSRYPNTSFAVDAPVNLKRMIQIAADLSQGFAHVRVDFYETKGKLYFSEMTFTSGSGTTTFEPEEYNRIYGDLIQLSEKTQI